jgi:hypothetical protein
MFKNKFGGQYLWLCAMVTDRVRCVPFQQGMAHPQVANGLSIPGTEGSCKYIE